MEALAIVSCVTSPVLSSCGSICVGEVVMMEEDEVLMMEEGGSFVCGGGDMVSGL